MYAIVQIDAQQFKVAEGDTITVSRLEDEVGKSLHLENVLLFSDGKEVKVGQPHLKEVKVSAEVLEHLKGKKKISYKYGRRKNRACKKGQREFLTRLKIKKIAVK
jgi:large subunit ribosomal protein L21